MTDDDFLRLKASLPTRVSSISETISDQLDMIGPGGEFEGQVRSVAAVVSFRRDDARFEFWIKIEVGLGRPDDES